MKTTIIIYSVFAIINLAIMLNIYFTIVKNDAKESKLKWLTVTAATVFGSIIGTALICYCVISNISTKNFGFIFRPKSFWMGIHYSDYNKRFCMNIIPCCTIWWIKKGGVRPDEMKQNTYSKQQVSKALDIIWLNFASHVPKGSFTQFADKLLNK